MKNAPFMVIILLSVFVFSIVWCPSPLLATTYHVAQKHPEAADSNPGTDELPLKTISAAAEILKPGDEVIVYKGTYRERVAPKRSGQTGKMITYRAADGETVSIKGSEVWKPAWRKTAPNVYEAYIDPELVKNYNPYAIPIVISPPISKDTVAMVVRPAKGPKLPRTLGQIFVDGIPQTP